MSIEEVDSNLSLEQLRDILIDKSGTTKLSNRFRALFNLKSIGEEFQQNAQKANKAIEYICQCFSDDSELLKHEVAYVLGQTKNLHAASYLRDVLEDSEQQCMVRHEAAEALGALGDRDSLPILTNYFNNDPLIEIRQTCELAIERINWEKTSKQNEVLEKSIYSSVDPAPPLPLTENYKIDQLKKILNDQDETLFNRYRAMFRLRDIGNDEACKALASAFADPSALLKHEIAYIFGQICNPVVVPELVEVLKKKDEAPMVRHEAAEALGAIATEDVLPVLKDMLKDDVDVVKESAIVALDMFEYENSTDIEYITVKN